MKKEEEVFVMFFMICKFLLNKCIWVVKNDSKVLDIKMCYKRILSCF